MKGRTKGLRKLCKHPVRQWSTCPCAWHFNFKWKDKHHRFSLDKELGRHIDSKTEAELEAATLKIAIKAGTYGTPTAVSDLTMRQLADQYLERKVAVKNAKTKGAFEYSFSTIFETQVPTVTGGTLPFGEWRVANVVTDTIERYREVRLQRTGAVGVNRHLGTLRTMFKWAVLTGYIQHTPFKVGHEVAIKLSKEHGRVRRLVENEDTRLFAACSPPLRAIAEADLETGMRKGEIMSLQWSQVEGMKVEGAAVTWTPTAQIALPWAKTKTKTHRFIPISTRLRTILEMRRHDPAGNPHPLSAFVFGTPVGTRLLNFGRAWYTAVLKSHGHTPTYSKTANLMPESRAALKQIDLHFHDLRREAGSRWLDLGVPLHTIRDWLGHTNISQTSAYLSGTERTSHTAMQQYEERKATLQNLATTNGLGGQDRPQAATGADEKPSKTIEGHSSTIM